MKFLTVAFALALSSSVFAGWQSEAKAVLREYQNECATTEVEVEQIEKNDHISGRVTGLPTDALEKFKVVFYVKSNRWYIHPYNNNEEGYAYSNLNSKGEFWIRTVFRTPSRQLAAVLVPKQVKARAQHLLLKPFLGLFGGVLKYKCAYSIVPGNGDFLVDPAIQ
jgi:hypothetical protein